MMSDFFESHRDISFIYRLQMKNYYWGEQDSYYALEVKTKKRVKRGKISRLLGLSEYKRCGDVRFQIEYNESDSCLIDYDYGTYQIKTKKNTYNVFVRPSKHMKMSRITDEKEAKKYLDHLFDRIDYLQY